MGRCWCLPDFGRHAVLTLAGDVHVEGVLADGEVNIFTRCLDDDPLKHAPGAGSDLGV